MDVIIKGLVDIIDRLVLISIQLLLYELIFLEQRLALLFEAGEFLALAVLILISRGLVLQGQGFFW